MARPCLEPAEVSIWLRLFFELITLLYVSKSVNLARFDVCWWICWLGFLPMNFLGPIMMVLFRQGFWIAPTYLSDISAYSYSIKWMFDRADLLLCSSPITSSLISPGKISVFPPQG